MGEGKGQTAIGDPGDQCGALLGRAAMAQKPATQHHRGQEWFERQRSAESLHRDHGFDRPAAGAAIALGKRQPEQPELGILPP